MESILIKDNFTKESKIWRMPMILFFVLARILPFVLIFNHVSIKEFIQMEIFLITVGCYFLYLYLYTYKYNVTVTEEKIILETLFKRTDVNFKDIKEHSCNKYKKTQPVQHRIRIRHRYKKTQPEVAFFFSGCSGRDRTYDQVINSHLLYR